MSDSEDMREVNADDREETQAEKKRRVQRACECYRLWLTCYQSGQAKDRARTEPDQASSQTSSACVFRPADSRLSDGLTMFPVVCIYLSGDLCRKKKVCLDPWEGSERAAVDS